MSSAENKDAPRTSQAVIAKIVDGFTEECSDERAMALGRGLANLLCRIGRLGSAPLIFEGVTTDNVGVGAFMNLSDEGAETMLERNSTPWTKPVKRRLYAARNLPLKFGDEQP